MAKFSTFPTLLNECKTIDTSILKKWGYLKPHTFLNGVINWSRNGEKVGSISICVNTYLNDGNLTLDYRCSGEPINYDIQLITKPSNLGKGVIWYFVCPKTGKLCRKLYLVNGYFYHRSASKGCMYETQTYSHRNRDLFHVYGKYFAHERAYEQIYTKHFKKHYNGKPTKKYVKLRHQISDGKNIDPELLYAKN